MNRKRSKQLEPERAPQPARAPRSRSEVLEDVRDLPPHLRGAMRGDQGFVEAGLPLPKKGS